MLKINFYQIKSKKNALGKAPIYLRINGVGNEINLSMNILEDPKYWDENKFRFKTTHPQAHHFNSIIQQKEKDFWEYVTRMKLANKTITNASIKRFLKGDVNSTESPKLLDAFQYFIDSNKGQYNKDTITHYKAEKGILEAFIRKQYKQNNINLEDVNYEFLTSYSSYLSTSRSNKTNTIAKHIKRIRAVINMSLKLEWIDSDPTRKYKIKLAPTTRITLTIQEVDKIMALDFDENQRLGIVRDLFCFMVYTGLSYSDLKNLAPENIDSEKKLIRISRQKSNEDCIISILPNAKMLIEKYENNPASKYKGKSFPVPSNQKMNKALKEIVEKAGINKTLTCHIGRHTFACIAVNNKVPMETISRALGHSSIKTTQIYSKVSSQKIEDDFAALNSIFGNHILNQINNN
jgi:site-specific recombinase XerD